MLFIVRYQYFIFYHKNALIVLTKLLVCAFFVLKPNSVVFFYFPLCTGIIIVFTVVRCTNYFKYTQIIYSSQKFYEPDVIMSQIRKTK